MVDYLSPRVRWSGRVEKLGVICSPTAPDCVRRMAKYPKIHGGSRNLCQLPKTIPKIRPSGCNEFPLSRFSNYKFLLSLWTLSLAPVFGCRDSRGHKTLIAANKSPELSCWALVSDTPPNLYHTWYGTCDRLYVHDESRGPALLGTGDWWLYREISNIEIRQRRRKAGGQTPWPRHQPISKIINMTSLSPPPVYK